MKISGALHFSIPETKSLSPGLFLSRRGGRGVEINKRPECNSATNSRTTMHSFIGGCMHDIRSGQQLSTGGRPRKTPLFDYSSTMAKEKPQGRGLARNDFRAPSKGTRSRTGRREARRSEEARKRKRRQERSEIYSRTQTDVNLFKLRDFGSGRGRAGEERVVEFIAARRQRLYLLYHCAGQGMGVERAGAREKNSILREIKKSAISLLFRARLGLRFFFFWRTKRETDAACPLISYHGD